MRFSGQILVAALAVVLPTGIALLSGPAALGQNNNNSQRTGPSLWGKAKAQPEVRLREPMELPDLPKFSGHMVFLGGHLRTTENGEATLMSFKVKESPDQVRDWYSSVLRMGSWKVTADKDDLLSARKNDNMCTVSVNPSRKNKEYPTILGISYFTGSNKNRQN